MYGPTTGDRVRLGDTSLWIQVEKDYTVYGDECKFGGGKSIHMQQVRPKLINYNVRENVKRWNGPGLEPL